MNQIYIQGLKDIPLVKKGDDLGTLIEESIMRNNICIEDGDVILIAQKIVSKSENRYVDLKNINPSQKATDIAKQLKKDPRLVQTILDESKKIISIEKGVIIVEHQLVIININAGIDKSNISENEDIVLLLPKNPSKSSELIHSHLSNVFNKNISIIITDSMTRPFRYGITNFAIASTNIQSIIDMTGNRDIYNKPLSCTEIAIADELACAAGLIMGQTNELMPVVLIKGFNKSEYETNDAINLVVNERNDLYR